MRLRRYTGLFTTLITFLAAAVTNELQAQSNTSEGFGALFSITTGQHNTGVGYYAARSTTSGLYNVGLGSNALYTNTTGSRNIALGFRSLFSNSSGDANIALGYDALYSNSGGAANIAVGQQALYANTTGVYNIALGEGSLGGNVDGQSSIAIGYQALINATSGYRNVAIGELAYASSVSGSYNIVLGGAAGINNYEGDYNIYIGSPGSPVSAGTESSTIRIGHSTTHAATHMVGITTVVPGVVNTPTYAAPNGPSTFEAILTATTDATNRTAELTLDGAVPNTGSGAQNVLMPKANAYWSYEITVTGASTNGMVRSFNRRGVLKNVAGTISWVGHSTANGTEIVEPSVNDSGTSYLTVTQATAPLGRLRYTVNQASPFNTTTKWTAKVEVVAVQQ